MIPPIEKDLTVPTTPERAFRLFWQEMGQWWPLATHSISGMNGTPAAGVKVEPRLGGTIAEIAPDGSLCPWGIITEWQEGAALAFTWQLNRPASEATQVRITFSTSDAGTRVRLVHSGWEARGASAAEDRANYDKGWNGVFLTAFAAAARAVAA